MFNAHQYERQIMQFECDLQRMSYLDRKTSTRLQIVLHKHQPYIRSTKDNNCTLRMLLFALLLKIYGFNSHRNMQRIGKMKEIVYCSQLESLTVSRGLLKEQMHKNIGVHLNRIKFGEKVEETLLHCFNYVAFFDQTLMLSFRQYFERQSSLSTDQSQQMEYWSRIIQQQFEIDMQQGQQISSTHIGNCIKIQQQIDGLYLLSTSPSHFDQKQNCYQPDTQASFQKIQILQNQKNKLLTVSIESMSSPMDLSNKQNNNCLNRSRQITPFQPIITQSRKTNKNQPFWSIFCCGSD